MASKIPLVRTSTLLGFIHFLERIGTPVDKLLQEFYLHKESIYNLNSFTSEPQMFGFMERAERLEGISHLGKLIADKSDVTELGVFGSLVLQPTTLRDCLNQFVKFFKIHHSDGLGRYWWIEKEQEVYFVCNNTPYRYKVPGSTIAMEYSLIFMLKVLRTYLGESWKPSQVYFRGPYSEQWEGCRLLTNAELYFNHDYGVIVFPSDLLNVVRPSETVHLPEKDLKTWLSSQAPNSFSDSLRLVMRSLINQQIFKIEQTAEILNTSPRTIQRRLLKEKTTYTHLTEQIRYEIAMEDMAHSNLNIKEISQKLGYSCPAHFTRAFRRWSGKTPTQFRPQLYGGKEV